MSVYLSGGGAGVSEQLLHDAQVGPTLEKVGGEGVAEGVGVHARPQSGLGGISADLLLYSALAQTRPVSVQEEGPPAFAAG